MIKINTDPSFSVERVDRLLNFIKVGDNTARFGFNIPVDIEKSLNQTESGREFVKKVKSGLI